MSKLDLQYFTSVFRSIILLDYFLLRSLNDLFSFRSLVRLTREPHPVFYIVHYFGSFSLLQQRERKGI
jgi:hypothetical protein